MTEPRPTPEKQNPPAAPDEGSRPGEKTSSPQRDGFFNRVQRVLGKPIHPSEDEEIVVIDGGDGD